MDGGCLISVDSFYSLLLTVICIVNPSSRSGGKQLRIKELGSVDFSRDSADLFIISSNINRT